jgi:hypothetical protein
MFVYQLSINQIKDILLKILHVGTDIDNILINPGSDYIHVEYDNYYDNGAEIIREEVILFDGNASRIGDDGWDETVKYRKYMQSIFGQAYKDYINWM